MQIWFFFEPGTGGDGVVNLIERASNFVSYDGQSDWWRIHRIVDNKPKFYAPTPDTQGCFRSQQRFNLQENQLNTEYKNCVLNNKNCVVASHDVTLQLLSNSDCLDIFCHNQIKVLLTNSADNILAEAITKNLVKTFPKSIQYKSVDETKFDAVLDVNKIQADWLYVFNFCQQFGIDLEVEQYHQYQDILKGNKTYMNNNFNIEEYASCIVGNDVIYTLVNIWQPFANKSIQ